MSRFIEPIFEIQHMEDIIEVVNSDPDFSREVKEGPLAEIQEAGLVTTLVDLEECEPFMAEGLSPEMLLNDDQTLDDSVGLYKAVLTRTQRRAKQRRASLRLEIPNPNAPGTGEQVASRFAPRAAPRISSMCYLTTEPELRTHEIESKVSDVIQGINDGIENLDQFCLMMMMSDDIDKLLFKLSVNQEILAGLLLKPLSQETRIAIRMRATFGES